jgi:hypothetical protein
LDLGAYMKLLQETCPPADAPEKLQCLLSSDQGLADALADKYRRVLLSLEEAFRASAGKLLRGYAEVLADFRDAVDTVHGAVRELQVLRASPDATEFRECLRGSLAGEAHLRAEYLRSVDFGGMLWCNNIFSSGPRILCSYLHLADPTKNFSRFDHITWTDSSVHMILPLLEHLQAAYVGATQRLGRLSAAAGAEYAAAHRDHVAPLLALSDLVAATRSGIQSSARDLDYCTRASGVRSTLGVLALLQEHKARMQKDLGGYKQALQGQIL